MNYKQKYLKYKLKYLLLTQQKIQLKQKGGLPGIQTLEEWIHNWIFPEKNERDLIGDLMGDMDLDIVPKIDESEEEEIDESEQKKIGYITPPHQKSPRGKETPPKYRELGTYGPLGALNF